MSREILAQLEEKLETFAARHRQVQDEREALATRLASVEHAYQDLLEQVRRYERERSDIRGRLGHILARLSPPRRA